MIALIQRVTQGQITINNNVVAKITQGLVVLIAIQPLDNEKIAQRLIERLLGYRVFEDKQGKMNLNLKQQQGGLLLVPQFTLAANTKKGLRPSFSSCAEPQFAKILFETMVNKAKAQYQNTESGIFSADMLVSLVNDGPVTFWLEQH